MGKKFTEKHEWIDAEGFVGITDYAQKALTDIVFVELPKIGASVKAGEAFGTVESVKAVSEICSPVSGTVSEINNELEDAPELLNEDAEKNWIIKLDFTDAAELDALMDEAEYGKFCAAH